MSRQAAALCVLTATLVSACDAELATDLSPAEANKIVATLQAAHIASEIEGDSKNGKRVIVSRSQLPKAMAVVGERHLIDERGIGENELLSDSSLIPSKTREGYRIQLLYAKRMEKTLQRFNGITDARVHIAEPKPHRRFGGNSPEPASASVYIKYINKRPDPQKIAALVAGAYPALTPERVNVITEKMNQPASKAPGLVRFGPIETTTASASAVRWLVGGAISINLLFLLALGFLFRRLRIERNQPQTKLTKTTH